MGVLSRFERRLGGLVEGAFARVFKGGVEPVELAGALREETDSRRAISATRTLVPNDFLIELSTSDHEHLVPYEQALGIELAEIVKDHATDQRYTFVGNVRVRFARNESLGTGIFTVSSGVIGPSAGMPGGFPRVSPGPASPMPGMPAAGLDQSLAGPGLSPANPGGSAPSPNAPSAVPQEPQLPGAPAAQPRGQPGGPWPPAPPPSAEPAARRGTPSQGGPPAQGLQGMAAAWNAIPGHPRLVVASVGDGGPGSRGGEYPMDGDHLLLGRTAEATVRLADTRVSRRHGEITRLAGAANGADAYIYRDLDSTNGSKVNGRRVSRAELHDGDRIEVGSTTLVFKVDPVGYPGYGHGPR